jgi:hypothetical protein
MVYNTPLESKKEEESNVFLEETMTFETDDRRDLYFDGVEVTSNVFGVNITLTLSTPHPKNEEEAKDIKRLITARTSLEHAKVFAMLLRKQIKTYEVNSQIDIKVPQGLYEMLGLDSNDW